MATRTSTSTYAIPVLKRILFVLKLVFPLRCRSTIIFLSNLSLGIFRRVRLSIAMFIMLSTFLGCYLFFSRYPKTINVQQSSVVINITLEPVNPATVPTLSGSPKFAITLKYLGSGSPVVHLEPTLCSLFSSAAGEKRAEYA